MIDFEPIGHKYSLNSQPYWSVTQMLSDLRLTPPYPETDPNGKKDLGSAIHKATELAVWDRLDVTKTSPVIIPYVNGFLEKKQEMRIRPIATELRLWDERICIAGTLDLFCWIYDEELAVIDYKSGDPPNCTELQTALYVKLLRNMMAFERFIPPQGVRTVEKLDTIRRFSMQLTPDRAVVREYSDNYDYAAAEGAVHLFKWLRDRRKGVSIET